MDWRAADPVEVDRPAEKDPVVRGLSESFGGPLGRHAAEPVRPFWTPARVVLALAVLLLAAHWIQKSPCQDGAWTDLNQYSQFCYTDVLALYYAEGLAEGEVPYRDHRVEYPVLSGAFMGAVGLPVHALGESLSDSGGINQGQWFYNITALLLSVFWVVTVGTVIAMRSRPGAPRAPGLVEADLPGVIRPLDSPGSVRPWDAAMLALAPGVLISATVNWDMLVIMLTTLGLYAWARRAPVVAGMLLGLAVAAKFYPLFLVGPMFLLALRSRRWQAFGLMFGTATLTWSAVNAPVALAWPDSWLEFFRLNSSRPVDWGTLWYVGVHFPGGEQDGFALFHWIAGDTSRLNVAWTTLFALCCAGIAVLAVLAPRRPRLAQLAFLVIACFLLTNKVWSQQFVLWLIPLVVLARPRWGAFLAWQAAEVGYFLAFYGQLMVASGRDVIPEWVFVFASLGRIGTLAVLVVLVAREVLRPELDVVRTPDGDDPDGGDFSGAPDSGWLADLQRWLSGGEPRRAPAVTGS